MKKSTEEKTGPTMRAYLVIAIPMMIGIFRTPTILAFS
jgi:hypothetical protein